MHDIKKQSLQKKIIIICNRGRERRSQSRKLDDVVASLPQHEQLRDHGRRPSSSVSLRSVFDHSDGFHFFFLLRCGALFRMELSDYLFIFFSEFVYALSHMRLYLRCDLSDFIYVLFFSKFV
jgi:hypothetical protein